MIKFLTQCEQRDDKEASMEEKPLMYLRILELPGATVLRVWIQ
jgi:hypothetical protein